MESLQYPYMSRLFTTSLLLLVIDLPWLLFMGSSWQQTIRAVQSGESAYFRTWAAIPVYIALAYLLLLAKSPEQAALIGLSTYAVFDFTNIAIFKQYPISMALLDSAWGAALFYIAYTIIH